MAINEIFEIPIGNDYRIIYNKYLFAPILLNKTDLFKKYNMNIDDIINLFKLRVNKIKKYHANGLGLYIGDNCNMKCKYCLRTDTFKINDGDIQKMFNSIKHFYNYNNDINNIVITGGEPFTNIETIYKIINFVNPLLNNNPTYTFDTNGTIINDKIINLLKSINYKISISIDGDLKTHDKNRIMHNDNGSFAVIENNINIYKQNNINIDSVLMVINDESLSLNFDDFFSFLMRNNIKYLSLQTEKYSLKYLKKKFNIINRLMSYSKNLGIECGGEHLLLIDTFLHFKDYSKEDIFFMSKCSSYNFEKINIDYNGNVLNCCYSPNRIYSLDDYKEFVDKIDDKYLINFYETNVCNSCVYWTFCTGKCNSIKENDAECFMKRLFFSFMLNKNYEFIKEIFV
jgi:uncharacterized protein